MEPLGLKTSLSSHIFLQWSITAGYPPLKRFKWKLKSETGYLDVFWIWIFQYFAGTWCQKNVFVWSFCWSRLQEGETMTETGRPLYSWKVWVVVGRYSSWYQYQEFDTGNQRYHIGQYIYIKNIYISSCQKWSSRGQEYAAATSSLPDPKKKKHQDRLLCCASIL